MLLKDVIAAVRSKVNDQSSEHWSDKDIVFWISSHNRMLFRERAQAEDLYGRVTHEIVGSDTTRVRQIKEDVFRYYLPTWWHKIYHVRDMTDKGLGVGATNSVGDTVPRRVWPRDKHTGWHISNDRTLDLHGYKTAPDLEIDVAKVPPLLHYGTIDKLSPATTCLFLASAPVDDQSNAFDVSREPDAFIGMELEITAGSSKTSDRRGLVSEVVEQDSVWDETLSAWLTRLTMFPGFDSAPRPGDTYEMHVPVDETNLEYMSALVARSLFAENRNVEGIRALEPMLRDGKMTFISGLRPRQEQTGDALIQPDFLGDGYYDGDKDLTGEVGW